MNTNVSPNSKKTASQGTSFAAALFTLLARVIPGTEARTAQATSVGLTLAPEEPVKSSSYMAGRSPESVAGAKPTGPESSAPARKSIKRADNLPDDPRSAVLALATNQTNIALNPTQIAAVGISPTINSSGPQGKVAAPERTMAATSPEPVQTLPETTDANLPLATLLTPAKDSGAPRTISILAVNVDTTLPENPNSPIGVEPRKIAAQHEGRSNGPADLPENALSNPFDVMPAMTASLQDRTLPVQPLHQNTNSAPSQESLAPRALHTTLGGTNVAPSTATFSTATFAGPSSQTIVVSKDDPNASLTHTQTGPLNGPVAHQSSDTRTVATSLASPNSEISSASQKPADPQSMPALETSSSLPITAIRVESWVAANLQSVPQFKTQAPSGSEATSRVEQIGGMDTNDLSPRIDAAVTGAEDISQKVGGENTVNHSQDSATDRSAGIPSSSFPEKLEAEQSKSGLPASASAPQRPQEDAAALPARGAVSGDGNTPINLIALSVPISKDGHQSNEAKSSNGDDQTEPTLPEADEDLQKEGAKTTASHASIFATDRRAANPVTSVSETVGAEQPKFQLTPPANAPQATQADAPSIPAEKAVSGAGTAPVSLVAPITKDAGQSNGANSSTGDDPQHTTSIESTHLTSQISKSDVKIALQGEQFGMVEFRAKVAGDQVSASITVEHHETHALLSSDLPMLHQLLADRQVRVSEIILLHDSLSGSSSQDGAPAKREEASPRQTGGPSVNGSDDSTLPTSTSSSRTGPSGIFDSRGRLSVRA